MNYAVLDIYRIVMSGNVAALAASALIDSYVYEYSTVLHLRQILFLKQLGSGTAGDKYGTYYQIGILYYSFHIAVIAYKCLDMKQ